MSTPFKKTALNNPQYFRIIGKSDMERLNLDRFVEDGTITGNINQLLNHIVAHIDMRSDERIRSILDYDMRRNLELPRPRRRRSLRRTLRRSTRRGKISKYQKDGKNKAYISKIFKAKKINKVQKIKGVN